MNHYYEEVRREALDRAKIYGAFTVALFFGGALFALCH